MEPITALIDAALLRDAETQQQIAKRVDEVYQALRPIERYTVDESHRQFGGHRNLRFAVDRFRDGVRVSVLTGHGSVLAGETFDIRSDMAVGIVGTTHPEWKTIDGVVKYVSVWVSNRCVPLDAAASGMAKLTASEKQALGLEQSEVED